MPILLGIKYITIPAGFDFTKDTDYVSNYLGTSNYSKGNVYCFFTLFFIPLIPLYCSESVWMDEDGTPIYKRQISTIGKIVNQLFGIVGMIILLILIGGVAGSISGGHVHRVRF